MKKILTLFISLSILSCDDGDISVPAFQFDTLVNSCDVINNDYTLFRLGEAEALIVTLSTSYIKEEETVDPIYVPIDEKNVIYRTFSTTISEDYFCSPIPPTSPATIQNWTGVKADSSFIIIETIESLDDNDVLIGYTHAISFQNLKLESEGNYTVFEEENFGEFTISLTTN